MPASLLLVSLPSLPRLCALTVLYAPPPSQPGPPPVQGFVALNVLVFDEELEALEACVAAMARAGVDAAIVQVCYYCYYWTPGL